MLGTAKSWTRLSSFPFSFPLLLFFAFSSYSRGRQSFLPFLLRLGSSLPSLAPLWGWQQTSVGPVCPHVRGSSWGVLEPALVDPLGASAQGLPGRRVRLNPAGTLKTTVWARALWLHVTSDPADPVPRRRARAWRFQHCRLHGGRHGPQLGILSAGPAPEGSDEPRQGHPVPSTGDRPLCAGAERH